MHSVEIGAVPIGSTMNHDWKIIKTASGVFVGHQCQNCEFQLGDWRRYVEYTSLDAPPQKVVDMIVGKCLGQ